MRRFLFACIAVIAFASPSRAQGPPDGIRLSTTYQTVQRQALAVRPIEAGAAIAEVADSVTTIVARDLRFSDRFNLFTAAPAQLNAPGAPDYRQWNSLNVVFLVTGQLTPGPRGYTFALTVHDVVYAKVVNQGTFNLPTATDPDFRMAVHAMSDEIVRWTLDVPGSAATRIATSRQNGRGSYDLLVMDSDGFGARRIAGNAGQLYSPVWSRDARRVLYAVNTEQGWRLIERDIRSGSPRTISPGGDIVYTPAYAPDGRTIAIGVERNNSAQLTEYDMEKQCCANALTTGRSTNMYPSFSGDGRRIAFMSNPLGSPAIYTMPRSGGELTRLSPYVPGQSSDYSAPSWSPVSSQIAFHGDWNTRLNGFNYQIMVADADRPGAQITQITQRGKNEDPSWAPDGRHIVYTSVGDGPNGLYIIDVETKARRMLASGGNLRMADWSPILLRAADLVARP